MSPPPKSESLGPKKVFPSNPPPVSPVTKILPEVSVVTPFTTSVEEVPSCFVHCFIPDELYLTRKMSEHGG